MNALPPLPDEQYEALKADIAARGVLVPVIVDAETGALVDGHHRVRACRELGRPFPRSIKRRFANARERREEAIRLNLLRRQLGPVGWAHAFERLCALRGVRLGSGGDRRSADALATDRAATLAEELGFSARTARRRLALAETLRAHTDLAAAVDRFELSHAQACAEARRRELEAVREQAARLGVRATLPRTVRVRVGDFATTLATLPAESVDLIYTDPPYLAKLDLEWIYGELGRQARRVLKPGGSLLAYSGGFVLPRTLNALADGLDYWWTIAIAHAPGRHRTLSGKKVRACWKPLLWFVKGTNNAEQLVDDLVGGHPPDKTLHDWAQSVEEARYYIERLTEPDALVVDPFCGSGTTLIAALECERRGLGIELDKNVAARARARIAEAVKSKGRARAA